MRVLNDGSVSTMYLPSGKKIVLYPIGKLAEELGRSVATIRQWELSGMIPKACFFTDDVWHARLYSAEQIVLLRETAEEIGLRTRGGRHDTAEKFSKLAKERWNELLKKYTRTHGAKVKERARIKNLELRFGLEDKRNDFEEKRREEAGNESD